LPVQIIRETILMQTMANLFEQLREKNIDLSLAGDQIKYRAPADTNISEEIAAIRGQREEILRLLKAKKAAIRPPIVPSKVLAPSFGQRLWWRWVTDEPTASPPRIVPVIKTYHQGDLEEVLASLKGMLTRHETLRSRFRISDGDLVVELNDPETFEIEVEEIPGETNPDGAIAAGRVNEFVSRNISVTDDWLIKAKVFVIGDKLIVALSVNHLIFDGASINILWSELDQVGKSNNPFLNTPTVPKIGYFDYVAWERNWFLGSGTDLVKYWHNWSQSVPALRNKHTGRRLVCQPGNRVSYGFLFPHHINHRLRRLAASLSTTPFLIYLTALSIAVAKWSSQSNFGIRAIGRDLPDLSSIVGYMTVADPIAVNLDLSQPFHSNLKSVDREYRLSCQLRLAGSLHTYPCYIVDPREYSHDSPSELAVLINYMPDRLPASTETEPEDSGAHWPPQLQRQKSLYWAHAIAPIDLAIREWAPTNTVTGLFRLNGTIFSDAECNDFMRVFFDEISEITK
jgi:hypothetical protein